MAKQMKKKGVCILLAAATALSLTACGSGSGATAGEVESGTQAQSEQAPVEGTESVSQVNATGYPVVDVPIELDALTRVSVMSGDFNSMPVFVELAEKTNVNVNFDQIQPEVWDEKINLILSSGELPDLIYGADMDASDIMKYGQAGYFLPLNDLIEEYAPNISRLLEERPNLARMITMDDGNIYNIPFYDEFLPENIPDTMFINQTWLDTLGLDMPTTTEEFYQVLKAFKEQDPNGNGIADEIPFDFLPGEVNLGDYSLYGSFGVLDNAKHLMVKDGQVLFSLAQEGYKEAVKYLNRLYTEGLIDPEVFTQDRSQYSSKGKQDDMTVGVLVAYTPENFLGAERTYEHYTDLLPLEGPDGDRLWNRYDMGYYMGRVVITSANPNPEATMRWIDEQFDEEVSVRLHWGEIGQNIEKTETGWKVLDEAPDGMSSDEYRFQNSPAYHGTGAILKETYDKIELATDKAMKAERYELYDPYAATEYLPAMRLSEDDEKEISTIFVDISSYVDQMKAKWITGESNVENDWEDYLKALEKMNVSRYVEIYQNAYDASLE